MNIKPLSLLAFLVLMPCLALADTTITYQGQLQDASGPYTGTPGMIFRLYDSLSGDNQIGTDIELQNVPVTDGLFKAELDFGDAYDGARWLEVVVDGNVLQPRQRVAAVPIAVQALNVPDGEDTLAELSCASGQVPKWNGSAWVCADDEDSTYLAGDGLVLSGETFQLQTEFTDELYWRQGGNAGTDPDTDFIGTTDQVPFEIRVDGQRALRVEPVDDGVPNWVAGHSANEIEGGVEGATISGGGSASLANSVSGNWGTVGGGTQNTAAGREATVGGGSTNTASANRATVGGGRLNFASSLHATVAGGSTNVASGESSTVGGGWRNRVDADFGTIAGGGPSNPDNATNTRNEVHDNFGTIGGGGNNQAGIDDGDPESAFFATVSGGRSNTASERYATVGGGDNNTASALDATVGGGFNNTASHNSATVGGGMRNTASGFRGTVPGGRDNEASGDDSFAAGLRAKAEHDGAFVWADSIDADFASSGSNQFLVRASGGAVISGGSSAVTDPGDARLYVDGTTRVRDLEFDSMAVSSGDALCITSSARVVVCGSTGRLKDDIEPLQNAAELVEQLRPVRYRWKSDGQYDVGLIAEEVAQVLPEIVRYGKSGEVETLQYSRVAAVLVGAFQELELAHGERLESLEAESAQVHQQVAELTKENRRLQQLADRNAELEDRLATLEALLLEDRQVAGGRQ